MSPPFLNKIEAIAKRNIFIELLIVYDTSMNLMDESDKISFTKIMETEDSSSWRQFRCEPQRMKENVVLILCSSGTTGLPKGVQLTQFNFVVANFQT